MISDCRGGSVDKESVPLLSLRRDEEGQRRGSERLCPPVMLFSDPAEYFLVRALGVGSWFPKVRRPRRGLEGMLTAPPVDEARDDDEGCPEWRKLSLLATEVVEPPPFHVDSIGEEPRLCSLRLSAMPPLSWLRPTEMREAREEEEGSDRLPEERGGTDFKDIGGRSEP